MKKTTQKTEDAALQAAKDMLSDLLAPLGAAERKTLLALLLKATE